ncbi:MAG: biotin attachment protein [Actinobacteria bacterium]|nr:biotin attachment protein [Actinomycetota bacterium]
MSEGRVTWQMPQLGNGIDTAIIQEWLIGVGESVKEGEPVVVVETDKASSDLEAPVNGTLVAVLAAEEVEVEIGEPLAEFEPEVTT